MRTWRDVEPGQRFGALTIIGRGRIGSIVYASCACGRRTRAYPSSFLDGDVRECSTCARIRNGATVRCRVGETYVAAARGLFKIGWSRDVAKRVVDLARQFKTRTTALLRIPGGEHEPLLHRLCFESHAHSEWFRDDERTRALIRDLAVIPKADRPARVRALYAARFAEAGSASHMRQFLAPARRDRSSHTFRTVTVPAAFAPRAAA